MGFWIAAPAVVAAALTALATLVATRRGRWHGRTYLCLALLCLAIDLLALGVILSGTRGTPAALAAAILLPAAAAACTFWFQFTLRFGQKVPMESGGDRIFAVLGALAPAALTTWGIVEGGLTWADSRYEGLMLTIGHAPIRGLVAVFLLVSAFGVVRFQALRIAARRARMQRLARASLGFLFGSLGLFLHAAQALLYGGAALHILAAGSIGLLPVLALTIPLYRAEGGEQAHLPQAVRHVASSMILMGLGIYLIALAMLGHLLHRLRPEQGILWIHFGCALALLALGTFIRIPSLRERVARWFAPAPYWPENAGEELERIRQPLRPGEPFYALLVRIGPILESMLGRTSLALWVKGTGERMIPWSQGDSTLPTLESSNPLCHVFRSNLTFLDLSDPPTRASRLPLYAENSELLQRHGFQIFLSLDFDGSVIGILGLALRERRVEGEDRLFVAEVANALAQALAASLPGPAAVPQHAGAAAPQTPRISAVGKTP